ncbi:MAG: helix-turn-helix domain-containing protein [Clostridia bacterium]|nr:helix-turn-helix domain-containing protein [Clostridia bacterium]
MKETMGQIIRRLRKERNYTQEELAELLDVTPQAISKWENDMGMPDVSQIVPIARTFGVSTDTLFGTLGANESEEVSRIVRNASAMLSKPLTSQSLLLKYRALQEGLKSYHNNTVLLMQLLETGLSLSYPDNTGNLYDAEHAEAIYGECIRYANLIISYSKNISNIMRARMIMVMLHSAHGNFSEANSYAEQFPYRADFNIHVMYAYYAHWKKDYVLETKSCQYGVAHYLEALLRIITRLAKSYMLQENYKEAASTLEASLELVQCIFKENDIMPPIHYRDSADMYALLAEAYIGQGDVDKALSSLEKMVEYDLSDYPRIDDKMTTKSPLLNAIPLNFYQKRIDRYQDLVAKLTSPQFDKIKTQNRYQAMLMRAKSQQ